MFGETLYLRRISRIYKVFYYFRLENNPGFKGYFPAFLMYNATRVSHAFDPPVQLVKMLVNLPGLPGGLQVNHIAVDGLHDIV